MLNFLIVRHAQSEWNAQSRWQGQTDARISAHGRAQATAAGQAISNVDAVVTSDLARAQSTANIIAEAIGVGPVLVDAGLRERDVGAWQGLTTAEIERHYPGAIANRRYPQGWENDESLLKRVFAALHQTAELVGSGSILTISHAGVLYAIERHFKRTFERVGNLRGRYLFMDSNGMRLGDRISLIDDGEHPKPTTSAIALVP